MVWPKLRTIRSPVSRSSFSTTRRLMSQQVWMTSSMCSITPLRPPQAASLSKKARSWMQPYLMTSAMPSEKVRSVRVVSTSGSMNTPRGCQKAPARFLPACRSMATLPPTEESTWARRVVGIWM